MAPGRWHNRINSLLVVVTFGGAMAAGIPTISSAAFAGGVLAGFIVNPDLDVKTGSIAFSNVRRTAGSLASWLWRVIWWPYSRAFRHRSFWTHTPLVGTLIRVMYLTWPLIFFVAMMPLNISGLVLAGLCLSDFFHWIMDGC